MTKTFLQDGLDAYARGDYVAAARAWCRGSSENPHDTAVLQYLQFLRGMAPAAVESAEQEIAASSAKADDAKADIVKTDAPSGPLDPWGEPALLGPTASVGSSAPGLALVAEATKSRPAPDASASALAARMHDAAGLDDFTGALKAADQLLAIEPLNADAKFIRNRARSVLTQMLVTELGTLDAIPVVAVPADQVIWLDLDQRAGFVLAQVDGRSSFSDIVAVTGMDELETLEILARLARDKIVIAHRPE